MNARAVIHATRFTVKEYLALEAVAEIRHEFTGGQIVAMAGAELAHNQIAHNLHSELSAALGDRPCHVLGSDQRVYVEAAGEYFYPDLLVTCLEPRLVDPKPQSLLNPQLIIEVLSETTERYDRGDKWLAYRTIPSLTDYVMVSSIRREVEHYQRLPDGSWTLRPPQRDGECVLASGVILQVGRLYRLVPGLS
ncbi:MAG TPA: Uma2 family endonuclease [Kofleriaceae bacterium]|jgi:Uma2 family endonuclease|nr:Uma2 family endonuclease [Kofleriaceae bacterium]